MTIPVLIGYISEWLGVLAIVWIFSLSPRFQRIPLGFQHARRDGIMALSLYGVILAFSFLFYGQMAQPIFPEPLIPAPAPVHQLPQAAMAAGLCLLPFLIALALRQQPPKSAGWRQSTLTQSVQLGVVLALLTIFLRNRVMEVLGGDSAPVMQFLPLALAVAVLEETIFRGYIQQRLAWWLKGWPGVVLTAILFTVWHIPAWLGRLPTETIVVMSVLTLAHGLLLGWMMQKSGHAAVPALYRAVSIWMNWMR